MTTAERLNLELDLRMLPLWETAGLVKDEEWTTEMVAAYMRAAYGQGHKDAMLAEDPTVLYTEYGYLVPGKGAPK